MIDDIELPENACQRNNARKDKEGDSISKVKTFGYQISDTGSEGKCEENGEPIESFPPIRIDAVN